MTRILSELLGATEPTFHMQIRAFERASGHPNNDIQLTSDIIVRTKAKIRDLGLDPNDTTGPELYHQLKQRLLDDDSRFRQALGLSPTATTIEISLAIQQFIRKVNIPRSCFALKTAYIKRLLKAQVPKKTMKALGYRSCDSMLKHEPAAQIYMAAHIYESKQWHKSFVDRYKQVTPGDFEVRDILFYFPKSKRWEKLAAVYGKSFRHTSMAFQELGAIVTLPVETNMPAFTLTSVLLLFERVNVLRCASAFLKLQQVRSDFSHAILQVAQGEPRVNTELVATNSSSLPWRVLQSYYHKIKEAYHPALFEPHVQPDDLSLVEAEQTLGEEFPSLEFWQDTADLALLHERQPVSLNMLDVALSAVNDLSFEDRIVHYVRDHISVQLIVRYLQQHRLHKSLMSQDEPLSIETSDAKGILV